MTVFVHMTTQHTNKCPPRRELGCQHFIGLFKSDVGAARAYDREASKLLGPDALLNFSVGAWVAGRVQKRVQSW